MKVHTYICVSQRKCCVESSTNKNYFVCSCLVYSPIGILRWTIDILRRAINPLHIVLSEFHGIGFSHYYWLVIPTSYLILIAPPKSFIHSLWLHHKILLPQDMTCMN